VVAAAAVARGCGCGGSACGGGGRGGGGGGGKWRRRWRRSGRRKGAKPLSAAQPRLPSEARELLPRGGVQGGERPRPSVFRV
jgi:hypothetical protein